MSLSANSVISVQINALWTGSFVTLCALLVLMQPMLRYVRSGWKAKRKDIMDSLSPKARLAYYLMFNGSEPRPKTTEQACEQFERFYTAWYGRRYFIVPGVLLGLTGLIATSAVVFSVLGEQLFAPNPLFKIPIIAIASLGGAYLWVVNDHISRARRLDFSPADVMWGVLRVVIAVPMGYAFSSIVKDDVAPFVAFGFGAFPLSALMSLLVRFTEKRLGADETKEEASDDLIKLQGINKTILERLSNEDVTTITQIAYCDPVRLTMRSNLSFNFIIDCQNQALAWMYLEDKLNTIRPFGIRGAFEIKYLMDDLELTGEQPEDKEARDKAKALLLQIASAINVPAELLRFSFDQIAGDPYTIFLYEIWETPAGLEDCSAAAASSSVHP